jgi:hypothetical protein
MERMTLTHEDFTCVHNLLLQRTNFISFSRHSYKDDMALQLKVNLRVRDISFVDETALKITQSLPERFTG